LEAARAAEVDRWRLFVAIELPDAISEALEAPLHSLQPLDSVVRRSQRSGIHLTLAFLGMVDGARVPEIAGRIRSATTGATPFTVEVTGAGMFPSVSRPQVLWVGIGGEERPRLVELAGRVASELRQVGFEPEKRAFHPHLTLGRVRRPPRPTEQQALRQWLAEWRDRAYGQLPVSALSLMRSQLSKGPPTYTRLETFRLTVGA
jgi:RNA 2',3'-cyclic 3'-phosphodiesterase